MIGLNPKVVNLLAKQQFELAKKSPDGKSIALLKVSQYPVSTQGSSNLKRADWEQSI